MRGARRARRQRVARRDRSSIAIRRDPRRTRTPSTWSRRATTASTTPVPDAFPCALPLANSSASAPPTTATKPASFSNYGAPTVDLFAPGVHIASTVLGSSYTAG